jgi:hypothetical protein
MFLVRLIVVGAIPQKIELEKLPLLEERVGVR